MLKYYLSIIFKSKKGMRLIFMSNNMYSKKDANNKYITNRDIDNNNINNDTNNNNTVKSKVKKIISFDLMIFTPLIFLTLMVLILYYLKPKPIIFTLFLLELIHIFLTSITRK